MEYEIYAIAAGTNDLLLNSLFSLFFLVNFSFCFMKWRKRIKYQTFMCYNTDYRCFFIQNILLSLYRFECVCEMWTRTKMTCNNMYFYIVNHKIDDKFGLRALYFMPDRQKSINFSLNKIWNWYVATAIQSFVWIELNGILCLYNIHIKYLRFSLAEINKLSGSSHSIEIFLFFFGCRLYFSSFENSIT